MRPKVNDPESIPKEAKIQKCDCVNKCDIFWIIFKRCLPMQKLQTDISYAFWDIASETNVGNAKFLEKNPLICKKVCTPHAWGGLKIMWLRVMGWHNLTNQQTDLVAQHRKCYGHSEMPEIHSQTAGIHLGKQWPHLMCFVCSPWGTRSLSYAKIIIFSGFFYFS